MVYYQCDNVYKPTFIYFVNIVAIFAVIFQLNSQELFKNKIDEADFIQRIYDLSCLTRKYYKEDNLEKLCEVLFIIQDYSNKISGNQFDVNESIHYLDKKLQQHDKFLSYLFFPRST